MIVIDSNALVVLILGLMDENLIEKHKRTSVYTKNDFLKLCHVIQSFENLVVLPNIWTEVDNLLNNFSGGYKRDYVLKIKELVSLTSEKYLKTNVATKTFIFENIGLTDALILELAKDCELLITSDSQLSDFAIANGIIVYDMKKERNKDFK